MKQTINYEELCDLCAYKPGLATFYAVHGDRTVSLADALESISLEDWLYVFFDNSEHFAAPQVRDVKLLLCDYAEHVLHVYESRHPGDTRVRDCIKTTRNFISGEATAEEIFAARAAAYAAAYATADTATNAAASAAIAAETAEYTAADADDAADAAADAAADFKIERKWQKEQLLSLVNRWGTVNEKQ